MDVRSIRTRRFLAVPAALAACVTIVGSGAAGGAHVAPGAIRFGPPRPAAKPAWTETILHSFTGAPTDGYLPETGLVEDGKGDLYGSALNGGALCSGGSSTSGCGVVFKMTRSPKGFKESVLYKFKGGTGDGELPDGPVLDASGGLYGTSQYGGTGTCTASVGSCGTVWKLTPVGKKYVESILYNFQGGSDGGTPLAPLRLDSSGALYGTTIFGGGGPCTQPSEPNGCGTVFKLTPTGSGGYTESILHAFGGGKGDGANPYLGQLWIDSKGALYGTTRSGGGAANDGIAYKLTPSGGGYKFSVIYHFKGGNDGANPYAGLIADANGVLYGTTRYGGAGSCSKSSINGCGTVFALTPAGKAYKETVLYSFQQTASDGRYPIAGLTLGAGGVLYGSANNGGIGAGTVFSLTPAQSGYTETSLYVFQGPPDGYLPRSGVILDVSGALYGTTFLGGSAPGCGSTGCGAVFELSP